MVDEPIDESQLRPILRKVLETGELSFTCHAFEEMEKDELVEQDIRNCLWAGRFDGCDFERGSWRYRVRTGWIVVVVALRSEAQIVVVTAWRER
ncbi:MAG: DUF4258 domain-containing protein [Gemmatimonadales bacterium]|jgi:hypothetical protein|nr:DUF4258 domain-containing protein [Gemmatimonadales bacterium]